MDRRIEAVLTAIAHDRGCSVEDLAFSANLSVSRLRHLFRQEVGIPLGMFARRSRLERARAILNGSFLSVKQVTFEAGYADETHFIREFRKVYGTTPGRYRRLQVSGASGEGSRNRRQIASIASSFSLQSTPRPTSITAREIVFQTKGGRIYVSNKGDNYLFAASVCCSDSRKFRGTASPTMLPGIPGCRDRLHRAKPTMLSVHHSSSL